MSISAPYFSVIIVAAGSGSRMGSETPKQYLPLLGKAVLRHTIDVFIEMEGLKSLHVVIHPDHMPLYEQATKGLSLPAPIIGGATRQESVYNALQTLDLKDDDIILIHDAARPCLFRGDVSALLADFENHDAVSLCAPVTETIRRDENGFLGDTIDREALLSLQTPQGFRFGLVKKAHRQQHGRHFTDDTSLVAASGIKVARILSSRPNPKITTAQDMSLAASFFSPIIQTKSAMGFDVHAFGEASNKIRIGGIDIPHTHRLSGHSDADVVLHAITDALYGVIADGDIGAHFPPSDAAHKGKNSAIFLEHACAAVSARNGKICHIDVTIMCEAPKIGPHRDAMRARIAELAKITIRNVSVKATTTERLGFTGRREGIAAQALVTVSLPQDEDS